MNADFFLRLPLYSLAFVLGWIEYILRTFLQAPDRFDVLPIAIASASLGLLVPLIVHDLPAPIVLSLSRMQQRTLRFVSAFALLSFVLGLLLWFALSGMSMKPDSGLRLPDLGAFGFPSALTWACGFYLIGVFLTEVKARVLQ